MSPSRTNATRPKLPSAATEESSPAGLSSPLDPLLASSAQTNTPTPPAAAATKAAPAIFATVPHFRNGVPCQESETVSGVKRFELVGQSKSRQAESGVRKAIASCGRTSL